MSENFEKAIHNTVNSLCDLNSFDLMYHRASHDIPMPSTEECGEIVELLREVLFPGYFGHSELSPDTIRYYIGTNLDKIYKRLTEQVKRGFCFDCGEALSKKLSDAKCTSCEVMAKELVTRFIEKLPEIRRLLATDVRAAYEGDPASKSYGETIFCYPSIHTMTNHRIAHELLKLDVPLIPRIISEMAHSKTGMDIHPGASIGEGFFIDHGTGTVIGETCVIGKNVRLYQGVTLGAKSFPLDKDGNPIKGIPRHPIVEDNVTIYSGATILGRVTIGKNSLIGGNVWLTSSVPPNSKVMQNKAMETRFDLGSGI